MKVTEVSLGQDCQVVGQKKQFEDITLSSWKL